MATVSSAMPHFGEEAGLSGFNGTGTVFFGGCNLQCVFCQNHDISQVDTTPPASADVIAKMMLALQRHGCHNIDLVSPTHVGPQVLEAIAVAANSGLSIPIIYNSNGYDSLEMLSLYDGVADIYLPDMKYGRTDRTEELSGVSDYVRHSRAAVKEMYQQVGDVVSDRNGVVERGLITRLLVLPDDLAGLQETLEFVADELSTHVTLSIMSQYHPAHRADSYRGLHRRLSREEYEDALKLTKRLGFENVWKQPVP